MLNKTPNIKQLEIMTEFVTEHKAGKTPIGDMLKLRAMQDYDRFVMYGQDKTSGFLALRPRVKCFDIVSLAINYEKLPSGSQPNDYFKYANVQKNMDTLESYYKRLLEAQ